MNVCMSVSVCKCVCMCMCGQGGLLSSNLLAAAGGGVKVTLRVQIRSTTTH